MKRTRRKPPAAESTPVDPGRDPSAEELSQLPPHSLEAEQGVLGCIMLSPTDCIGQAVSYLKAGSAVFYDLRHRTIYDKCVERWDKQLSIDIITLQQALKDDGTLEGVGGLAYLATLPDAVPSAANLEYYLEIVLKKFALRRLIQAGVDIADKAKGEPEDVAELMAEAIATMEAVGDCTQTEKEVSSAKVLVPEALNYLEHLELNAGKVTGLATGFPDLDALTWGLQPSELAILAARPSVGKTALCLNIADFITTKLKIPVAIFSLEMSEQSLMVRLLCSKAAVSTVQVRKGQLSQLMRDKLMKAAYELVKAPLYIDDTSGISILQLRAKARRMVKQFGIKLVIVDYLQLMTAPLRRNDNRQQEVSNISAGLKNLAKEEKIAVLALSQLSRKMDDRGTNARPKLSDLRESGSIEQDADVVLLLHRHKGEDDKKYSDVSEITGMLEKNRQGPTGEVDLVFLKSCTRFESAAKPTVDHEPEDAHLL